MHKESRIADIKNFLENSCEGCGKPGSKDVARTFFPLKGNLSICMKLFVSNSVLAARLNLLKTSEAVFSLLLRRLTSNITKITIACSSLREKKKKKCL